MRRHPLAYGFVVRARWACQKGRCACDVMKGAMGEASGKHRNKDDTTGSATPVDAARDGLASARGRRLERGKRSGSETRRWPRSAEMGRASSTGFTTNSDRTLAPASSLQISSRARLLSPPHRIFCAEEQGPFRSCNPGAGCVRLLGHCAWQLLCAPGACMCYVCM